MTKRILITGAAGLIASNLCRWLLRRTDWDIVALDRLDPAGSLARLRDCFEAYPSRIAMVHHDLRAEVNDVTAIDIFTGRGRFAFGRFDYIAHLAASSHVDRAMLRPIESIQDNVIGTAHLFEFVRQQLALTEHGKVLHVSTDEVMGPAPIGVSFKPGDRQRPRNIYSAGKAGAESLAFAYAETFGMPILMTRCTNVVAPIACETDPGQDKEKFIPLLVGKLLADETVQIHTVDGVPCSRYYVHVANVCSAMQLVLEHGGTIDGADGGIFHISGDQELDNIDVAALGSQVLGRKLRYELVERPPNRLRPDLRYCLDDSSLLSLGWKREIGCLDGLREVFASYLAREQRAAAE